jgi:hypothetical protein
MASAKNWVDGAPSIWEGSIDFHDLSDAQEHISEHVQRLLSPHELRTFDFSQVASLPGSVNAVDVHCRHQKHVNHSRHEQEEQEGPPVTICKVVKNLSLNNFRSKLIKHFDIAFQRNKIKWPGKRNRVIELAF